MLHLVKVGGTLIEDEFLLENFLKNFHMLRGYKILIHGGGKYASRLSKKLGIHQFMVEGRRITKMKTLEVLVMSYAGILNKKLVASLQALGTNALGLSGSDVNFLCTFRRNVKSIDYGHVGDLNKKSFNIKNLYSLLQLNYIPIICSITYDNKGNLMNTNADTIAAYIAICMSEVEEINLHFCFEKKGVLKNNNSYYTKLNISNFFNFRILSKGMIPKINNAFYGIKKGVKKVSIGYPSFFRRGKDKTLLYL